MTRRILLVLDESVTGESCGAAYSGDVCKMLSEEWRLCTAYRRNVEQVATEDMISDWYRRLPECLAAEQAAERCVEIEPGDANSFLVRGITGTMENVPAPIYEGADRAFEKLNEHAAKARGGGGRE